MSHANLSNLWPLDYITKGYISAHSIVIQQLSCLSNKWSLTAADRFPLPPFPLPLPLPLPWSSNRPEEWPPIEISLWFKSAILNIYYPPCGGGGNIDKKIPHHPFLFCTYTVQQCVSQEYPMMAGPDQLFQSYSTVHNNGHPKKHFHQKGSPNSFCKIKSILFSKKVKPILRLTITVPNLYVLKWKVGSAPIQESFSSAALFSSVWRPPLFATCSQSRILNIKCCLLDILQLVICLQCCCHICTCFLRHSTGITLHLHYRGVYCTVG